MLIVHSALFISSTLAASFLDNAAPEHREFVLFRCPLDDAPLRIVSGVATVDLSVEMASNQEHTWTSSAARLQTVYCNGNVIDGGDMVVMRSMTSFLGASDDSGHQLSHFRAMIGELNTSPELEAFIAANCGVVDSPVLSRTFERVNVIGSWHSPTPTAAIFTETIRGEHEPRMFYVDRLFIAELATTDHPMITIAPINAEYSSLLRPELEENNNLRGANQVPANEEALSEYLSEHARFFQIELTGDDWREQLNQRFPLSFSDIYDKADDNSEHFF